MIMMPERMPVIENIKKNVEAGRLNDKVEVGDPSLTPEESRKVLDKYLAERKRPLFRTKNLAAGRAADVYTWAHVKSRDIVGLEKIKGIDGGAFITSNHFNPEENTTIRRLSQKMHRGNLYIVSQDTNLCMDGVFGFFLYYMDIIPISEDKEYMANGFNALVEEAFRRKQNILIYPEQEMWFNYRKPRPLKRGAYLFAAEYDRPVISCFVEIRDLPKLVTPEFHDVRYILHVLDPIYPDPSKSARNNSIEMMHRDYEQKVSCYEECYGKKLTYDFEPWDVAGWIPPEEQIK